MVLVCHVIFIKPHYEINMFFSEWEPHIMSPHHVKFGEHRNGDSTDIMRDVAFVNVYAGLLPPLFQIKQTFVTKTFSGERYETLSGMATGVLSNNPHKKDAKNFFITGE